MKSIIVYSSKTGNTEKVANAIQKGLGGTADMLKLDLTSGGLLKQYTPLFTLDLSAYDVIFLGAWVMVMKVHPFTSAYINMLENLEGRKVAGFITGGTAISRPHVYEDFCELIDRKGAEVLDFYYAATLLGPLLTRKKLERAEAFARKVMAQF
jgi:flavodoxin